MKDVDSSIAPHPRCEGCGFTGGANSDQITALHEHIGSLEAKIVELATEVRGSRERRKPVDDAKQLLSLREAARCLGVCRKTTLRNLIAAGLIATVPGTRGARIPRSEIERLQTEGIPEPATTTRRRKRDKKLPVSDGSILAIEIN